MVVTRQILCYIEAVVAVC